MTLINLLPLSLSNLGGAKGKGERERKGNRLSQCKELPFYHADTYSSSRRRIHIHSMCRSQSKGNISESSFQWYQFFFFFHLIRTFFFALALFLHS